MTDFTLHLLRHGAPETPGLLMGHTDGPPTQGGIEYCRRQVHDLGIAALVSSDLSRAQRAADAIGRDLDVPPAIDNRWRELDFGAWDGLPTSMVEQGALERFWEDPDANPPPSGERWSSLVGRVAAAIAALKHQPTLIVTHGGAMRAALAHLCGLSMAQTWAIDLSYGALLELRVWPGAKPSAQITGLRT